jgi:O-antigen ligase
MLPPTLLVVWRISTRFTFPARSFLTATYAAGALGCLFWSGSKAGWLLAVLAGLIVLLHLPIALRLKISLVAAIALLGLSGFVWRYSGYFDRGAASVHARFDYWRAATETMISKPVLGSGPGTFGIAYKAIKRPESEMARLAHNDFLQQGSDSGVIGFLTYLAWVCGIVWFGRPRFGNRRITFQLVVWLGVLGFCLQGIAEFGLYIPALAWPAFAMSGWILNSEAEPIRVSSETSRNQVIATVTLSDGRSPV